MLSNRIFPGSWMRAYTESLPMHPHLPDRVFAPTAMLRRVGERGDPDKPYACPQCGKRYGWKKSLNLHIRQECGKDPQFHCPLCDHRSKQKSNLVSHIRHRHEKDLPTAKLLAKVKPHEQFSISCETGSESPASSS